METERKNMNIRNVDVSLKYKFRALCLERGKTLSEEIQRLMREELERREKELEKEGTKDV